MENKAYTQQLYRDYKELTGKDYKYKGKGGIDKNSYMNRTLEQKALQTSITYHRNKKFKEQKAIQKLHKSNKKITDYFKCAKAPVDNFKYKPIDIDLEIDVKHKYAQCLMCGKTCLSFQTYCEPCNFSLYT